MGEYMTLNKQTNKWPQLHLLLGSIFILILGLITQLSIANESPKIDPPEGFLICRPSKNEIGAECIQGFCGLIGTCGDKAALLGTEISCCRP